MSRTPRNVSGVVERVTVSLDRDVVGRLDLEVGRMRVVERGMNRSLVVERCLREWLNGRERERALKGSGE